MAGFKLEAFRGVRPRIQKRLLGDLEAIVARNLRLGSGALRPLREQSLHTALAKTGPIKTIYPFDGDVDGMWMHWAEDVDVVPGPLSNDVHKRHYYTGDAEGTGAPKMVTQALVDDAAGLPANQYPRNWRYLGIPAPGSAVTLSAQPLWNDGTVTDMNVVDIELYFNPPATLTGYSSILSNDDGVGQAFEAGIAEGDEFVVTVLNGTQVSLSGADGRGYVSLGSNLINNYWHLEHLITSAHQKVNGQIRLPNGRVTVTWPGGHGLRTGDVIRVTNITSQPTSPVITTFNGISAPQLGKTNEDRLFSGAFDFDVVRDEAESGSTVVDRAYVYTFVSDIGEEGPPSPPTDVIQTLEKDTVGLSGFSIPPTDHRVINELRIYRTNVSDTTADFQLVGTITDAGAIAAGTATFDDNKTNFELGELLQSTEWEPPDPNMKGLVSLPNGVLAGFFGKTVAFSEPYFPHAWPPSYQYTVEHDVVGLGVHGNSVGVYTKGVPYEFTGAHPRQMNSRRIEVNQSCVAKRGIANIGTAVLYPSPDGLIAAGSGGYKVVTEQYFSRDEWQALKPETLVGFSHDEKYIALFDDGVTQQGFIFDPQRPEIGLTYMDDWAYGGYEDLRTDTLYLSDGDEIYTWDTGAAQTMTWRSKELRAPAPMNPSAARVVAKAYPVTFRLYAEGTLRHTRTVNNDEAFRLPGGYLADIFEIEVEGTNDIHMVHIGETMAEVLEG